MQPPTPMTVGLDVVALPHPGPGEPRHPSGARRVTQQPDRDQDRDADQHRPGDELGQPLEWMRAADPRQRELRVEHLPVGGDQGEEQQAEADEHEPVRGADKAPLEHPGVAQRLAQGGHRAAAELVGPTARWLAQPDDADDLTHRAAGQRDGNERDRNRHDDRGGLHRWSDSRRLSRPLPPHYASGATLPRVPLITFPTLVGEALLMAARLDVTAVEVEVGPARRGPR